MREDNLIRQGGATNHPFDPLDTDGPPPGLILDLALTVPAGIGEPRVYAVSATPYSLMLSVGVSGDVGVCYFALSNPSPGGVYRATWSDTGSVGWLTMGALPSSEWSRQWDDGVGLAPGVCRFREPRASFPILGADHLKDVLGIEAGEGVSILDGVVDDDKLDTVVYYVQPSESSESREASVTDERRPVVTVNGVGPDEYGILWMDVPCYFPDVGPPSMVTTVEQTSSRYVLGTAAGSDPTHETHAHSDKYIDDTGTDSYTLDEWKALDRYYMKTRYNTVVDITHKYHLQEVCAALNGYDRSITGKCPDAFVPDAVTSTLTILEFPSRDSFPEQGVFGKIYAVKGGSARYRWKGTTYEETI
jgi:hypothetical protein